MAEAPSREFSSEVASAQPPNTTILITSPPQVWIDLPEAGNLWVGYEFEGEQPAQIYLSHQGGTTTPIPPGFGTYECGANDSLVYQLVDPNQSIKLGWAYV